MPNSRPPAVACALAALVTVATVCAGDAAARGFPFGPHTRSVNDLGNQFVPFHTRLWDLLHGQADGGVLLNWQSGFGTSFPPDLGTYLTSPFALLVGVFPRDRIDLAVYAVTVLKMASAAAAMAFLLLTLRGGHRWAAGVLGASYALCGWSVLEATYNPMWLDGLVALPLLCLAGEWARTGRHRVAAPLVVAVLWIANFYTAYMATLGAALVLVVRLVTESADRGAAGRGLLRAAGTVALGIGLAAPVLLPVYLGTKHAYPGWTRPFAPAAWPDVLARLLPATYGFFTPALFLGTGTLLLACALAFQKPVPRRERWAWAGLVAAVALSLQWGPTHLLWHAFATPNGSPYRQTFVLAGILVIAAWISVSYDWPGWRALLGGGAVLVAVGAGAASSGLVTRWTYPLFAAGLLAAGAALALVRRGAGRNGPGRGRGWYAVPAVLLLVAAQAGQAAATTAYADRQRLARLDDYAPWGARQSAQAEAVDRADGWPRYRTDPGREPTTANDPLVVGGQGGAYYSSHTPDVLTRTVRALGGGWTSRGRAVQSLDNPVTDAIFSVGARLRTPPDPHQPWNARDDRPPTVARAQVPPLVTVRGPGAGAPPVYGRSPFRNQEKLLGTSVYTVPPTTLRDAAGAPAPEAGTSKTEAPKAGAPGRGGPGRGASGRGASSYRVEGGAAYTLTAACPAGREVYLWAPDLFGRARLAAARDSGDRGGARETERVRQTEGVREAEGVRLQGQLPLRSAAMERLGTPAGVSRGASGGASVQVTLEPERDGTVPHAAIGCLDTARLASAVTALTRTGATSVHVTGDGVRAELPPGTSGTAVLAAPRIAGWSCGGRPAGAYLGLVAVPVPAGATSVSCTFRPPGLRAGAAVGTAALLVLLATAAAGRLTGRRTARPRRPWARPADPVRRSEPVRPGHPA
ncbi:YfhO family protein [Streptomyces sp. NBC_01237]|uniref:YfhO family protein n=1 Tax=Streptomyces sp. NBC_01237 TaxID=2903790 RepID=UPI002DD7F12D|nr:YfhO family protein [Streptomyces sp. NBC_01237]WRZ72925.1 YfhO family protein [Streptomyces sp. NBC_01237]